MRCAPRTKEEFVRLLTAELPERPDYFALDAELNRTGAAAASRTPAPGPAGCRTNSPRARQPGRWCSIRAPPSSISARPHSRALCTSPLVRPVCSAATLLGLDHDLVWSPKTSSLEESRLAWLASASNAWSAALRRNRRLGRRRAPVAQIRQVPRRNWRNFAKGFRSSMCAAPRNGTRATSRARCSCPRSACRKLADIDPTRPVAVHCKGGYRSAIACSLIQRAGFDHVMNLIGGYDAWRACGARL